MTKFMISISDEMEQKVRKEVKEKYYDRIGGLSIFFETLCREYFKNNGKRK